MFHNGHRPFSNKRDVKKMIQDLSLHSICYIRPIPPSDIQQSRQQVQAIPPSNNSTSQPVPAIPPSNNSTSQPDPAKEIERLNNELKKKEDDLEMAEDLLKNQKQNDLLIRIEEVYEPNFDFNSEKWWNRFCNLLAEINIFIE